MKRNSYILLLTIIFSFYVLKANSASLHYESMNQLRNEKESYPATTCSVRTPPSCADAFIKAAHDQTNMYRAKHLADPLSIESNITSVAAMYSCYLADNDLFEHNMDTSMGENLYMSSSSDPLPKTSEACAQYGRDAVDAWYNEIKSYDFTTGDSIDGGVVGHFTQLVWKNSKKTGYGLAFTPNGLDVYVVANYDPAGNYNNEYAQNVLEPIEITSQQTISKNVLNSTVQVIQTTQSTQTLTTNFTLKPYPPTTCLAQTPSSCSDAFIRAAHVQTNMYRARHSAGPLSIESYITNIAANYSCYLADNYIFEHNMKISLGENLYTSSSSDPLSKTSEACANYGREAVDAWYNEINSYDFLTGSSKDGGVIGHFTQLVWKGSSKTGYGIAFSSKPDQDGFWPVYVVVNYDPSGNFVGEYLQNVLVDSPTNDNPDNQLTASNSSFTVPAGQIMTASQTSQIVPVTSSALKSYPPTTCSVQTPPKCVDAFIKAAHDQTNIYRARHSAGPLTIESYITNVAANYSCYLADNFIFEHNTDNNDMGENLYTISFSEPFIKTPEACAKYGKEAVDVWYNEIKSYDFSTGESKDGGVVGHFTQLVWKDSKKTGYGLGFSSQPDNDGFWNLYIVANYDPAGNIVGAYPENVVLQDL